MNINYTLCKITIWTSMQFLRGQQEEEDMKWGGNEDKESFLEHIYFGSSSLLCYPMEWNLNSSREMFVVYS